MKKRTSFITLGWPEECLNEIMVALKRLVLLIIDWLIHCWPVEWDVGDRQAQIFLCYVLVTWINCVHCTSAVKCSLVSNKWLNDLAKQGLLCTEIRMAVIWVTWAWRDTRGRYESVLVKQVLMHRVSRVVFVLFTYFVHVSDAHLDISWSFPDVTATRKSTWLCYCQSRVITM